MGKHKNKNKKLAVDTVAHATVPRKITDAMISRSRMQREILNPFQYPQHPPQCTPAKSSGLAMDDVSGGFEWASQSAAYSAFHEGTTFLGYPYLAELSQRPEYRLIVGKIAKAMTRKWIKLKAKGDKDKTEKIAELEDELIRLKVKDVFCGVAEIDGYFGRSHLYIDTGSTDDPDELKHEIGDGRNEISLKKFKKGSLERISAVEPVWCYPTRYNSNDPLSPDWYKPRQWFVLGKEIHHSRLLTFIGREVPDLLKPAYSFGGLALTQMAKPYVDNWLRTRQSVSDLLHSFTVWVVKTNLSESTQGDGDLFFKRLELFNNTRDNRGVMAVDKDTEDFTNVTAPLGGLSDLQAQSLEQVSCISSIPIVEFTGNQPAGLNASSEGEIQVWHECILSYQEQLFREPLTRIISFAQLNIWGKVDEDIIFDFEPLKNLDEAEEATVDKTKAETDQIRIDTGVISPEEARKRVAADENTPYDSLDIEDVPELPTNIEGKPIGAKKMLSNSTIAEPGRSNPPKQNGASDSWSLLASDVDSSEGTWVTIRGSHILVKDGEIVGGAKGKFNGEKISDLHKKETQKPVPHVEKKDDIPHTENKKPTSKREMKEGIFKSELNDQQKKIMKEYGQGNSYNVNAYLKDPQAFKKKAKADFGSRAPEYIKNMEKEAKLIDAAINNSSIENDLDLYRGVSDFAHIEQKIEKLYPGESFSLPTFSSTSKSAEWAKDFVKGKAGSVQNPGMIIIKAKAGTKALNMDDYSRFGKDEQEVLLGRNADFKFERYDKDSKTVYLSVG